MAANPGLRCDHQRVRHKCDQCGEIVDEELVDADGVIGELETTSEFIVRRISIAGVMMVLLSTVATLWGIDGAFRILFTAFVVWVGYTFWVSDKYPSS